MSFFVVIVSIVVILALAQLILDVRRGNLLLEHIRNQLHNEIERRKELKVEAEEAEITRLSHEADLRAEEEDY